MNLCISVVSDVISPVLFLILFICLICLAFFFSVILAKVCEFCLSLIKKLLSLMIVFYYHFGLHYNDFYSDFYYILPLPTWSLIISLFLFHLDVTLNWYLRFFLGLRQDCISVNILLILLWLYPIAFGMLHFHFCLSSGVF